MLDDQCHSGYPRKIFFYTSLFFFFTLVAFIGGEMVKKGAISMPIIGFNRIMKLAGYLNALLVQIFALTNLNNPKKEARQWVVILERKGGNRKNGRSSKTGPFSCFWIKFQASLFCFLKLKFNNIQVDKIGRSSLFG